MAAATDPHNLIWITPALGRAQMRKLIFGLVAALSLLLTSCSTAAEPKVVRLAVHESFVVSADLVAEFEAETGYQLEIVKAGDAGSLVSAAVLAAGNPTADVLFGVDNTMLQRALDAGVFASYVPATRPELRPELLAGDFVTPVDYGDVCVNVDDSYFTDRQLAPPQRLSDLTLPRYRNLLVVEDPAASSPGLAFLLATIAEFGDGWEQYWSQLLSNGTKVAGSWSDAYFGDFTKGGGSGDYPLVVSYATSPPAEIVYAEEPKPTTVSTSVMTSGCYRQVEYVGVLAGAANPAGARAVVDWLTSKRVQEDVPLSMFVFPARSDAKLPEVFTKFAGVAQNPSQLDPQVVRDSLAEWLATWDSLRNG